MSRVHRGRLGEPADWCRQVGAGAGAMPAIRSVWLAWPGGGRSGRVASATRPAWPGNPPPPPGPRADLPWTPITPPALCTSPSLGLMRTRGLPAAPAASTCGRWRHGRALPAAMAAPAGTLAEAAQTAPGHSPGHSAHSPAGDCANRALPEAQHESRPTAQQLVQPAAQRTTGAAIQSTTRSAKPHGGAQRIAPHAAPSRIISSTSGSTPPAQRSTARSAPSLPTAVAR